MGFNSTFKGLISFLSLTFVWPCIVIYLYSKTNQMHSISNLFYFGTTLYKFRTVSLSIIRSLRLYIQHQVYVIRVLLLLAIGNELEHLVPASKQVAVSVWHIPVAVCTVLNSRWWTERPSETCRVSFQKEINLRNWCIWLVLLTYLLHGAESFLRS